MGWHRIGIVHTSDSFGISLKDQLDKSARLYDIQIVETEMIYLPTSTFASFEDSMTKLRQQGSYVNIILTTDAKLLRALHDLQKTDMMGPPYVWITLNNVSNDITTYFSNPGRPPPSTFNGLIMLDVFYNYTGLPEYDEFRSRWLGLDPQYYPGAGPGTDLNYFQGRAYSCIQMLARGYQSDIQRVKRERGLNDSYILELLRTGTYPRVVGNLTAGLFSTVEYTGPAGKIKLDTNGDPTSGKWVFYQLQDNKAVTVGEATPTNATMFQTTIQLDKHQWPKYGEETPPDAPDWVLQNLRWREPIAQAFGILANIGMMISILVMVIVIWKRKDPVIKASSPYFCVLEIIGIILVYSIIIIRTGRPKMSSCIAMPLVIVLGSTLLLGSLIVKNLRIYRIFSNVYYNKYTIKNSLLARQVAVILVVCMLAPSLYVVVTRPMPTYIAISATKSAILCLPSNHDLDDFVQTIFMVFMVIPTFVLLIIAGFLAYSTQHVAANWNEAKAMAYTIYNILFAALVCIPTLFFPNDLYRASILIQNSMIILAATVSLLVLFGPRLLIMRQRALRARKQSGSSSTTGYQQSSYSGSHSGSGNGTGSGNGRKDDRRQPSTDGTFCRSRKAKDPNSHPCPHTSSFPQPFYRQPSTTDDRDPPGAPSFGQHQQQTTSGDGGSGSTTGKGDRTSTQPALSSDGTCVASSNGAEGSPSAVTPFTSMSPTDYFQHPRVALASLQAADPLGPSCQFVQMANLASPVTPSANVREAQQFDAIRFRTGVLGNRHSPNHHHQYRSHTHDSEQADEYDLHVPAEEEMVVAAPAPVDRNRLHNVAMMIGQQPGQLVAGTIPVLVMNGNSWVSHLTSRWRAMRVIVVSSLGMVMLIDPKKVKTETFLYIEVSAVTEHRHFFLHLTCEHDCELRLEYPCAQARDQWMRSFTTMGTIHDSNQLNPLRHRHHITGSSNVSNNSSEVAIIQQPQQQPRQEQLPQLHQPQPQHLSLRPSPMYNLGSVSPESSESVTPPQRGGGALSPIILNSTMDLAEFGRPREYRDSGGSETPLYAVDTSPRPVTFQEPDRRS
ncbi:hypothetical protein DFQ27_004217 [Actinomortierella ambigua]|uniref:G-protein coupled receptors family 3 profile domain-containing protein n=1 Tax=Actinomortierella ambigua TaxID=1343610 RepID=A0A9P6Q532_9FUNG|nr:hypothetical protein DFQ27_004217 [Actinomortierella ambigua]